MIKGTEQDSEVTRAAFSSAAQVEQADQFRNNCHGWEEKMRNAPEETAKKTERIDFKVQYLDKA